MVPESPRPPRQTVAPAGGPLDPSVLAQLKDLGGPEDPGFLPGVLRAFLDHLDRARDVWRAPRSAPAALRAAAHGLKGAAGNVGAKELARCASALHAAVGAADRAVGAAPAVVAAIEALEDEAARVRAAVGRLLVEGTS